MNTFITRHAQKITGSLTCFDRLVFHGHLPINYSENLHRFIRQQGLKLEDFSRFVQRHSEHLRQSAEQMAAKARRPFIYLQHFSRKEDLARRIAEKDKITQGLVCILRATETCRSFGVRRTGNGTNLRLTPMPRRCLHLYFYFLDRQLGWLYVRLQTWFPFLIQIGINGHEVLARQLDRRCIPYTRCDNAFTSIKNLPHAQRLADGLADRNWIPFLDNLARQVNPLLHSLLRTNRYYWVTDQCEVATDVLFQNQPALQPLYTSLLRHTTLCFSPNDILGFLGRKLHGLFKGDVFTEYKHRQWGVRVKHRVQGNWIKMYNKAGQILRVETVINDPHAFLVRRTRTKRNGQRVKGWFPLPKSVAFIGQYFRLARQSNSRYLEALAAVEDPTLAYREIQRISAPARLHGRTARPLNPLAPDDHALLQAVLRGENLIHGFRNEHIRQQIYPAPSSDPLQQKRLSARIRRKLLMLRAHKLIARVPRSRRYVITALGYRLIAAAIYYSKEDLPNHMLALKASIPA